jgi:hypothetical protein
LQYYWRHKGEQLKQMLIDLYNKMLKTTFNVITEGY